MRRLRQSTQPLEAVDEGFAVVQHGWRHCRGIMRTAASPIGGSDRFAHIEIIVAAWRMRIALDRQKN
jgi:hypothetical protein